MKRRGGMWAEVSPDQFCGIHAREQACLPRAALRQTSDSQGSVQGDSIGKIGCNSAQPEMRQFAAEQRPQVRKPGTEHRVDVRIPFSEAHPIQKEKNRTQGDTSGSRLVGSLALNSHRNGSIVDEFDIHHGTKHTCSDFFVTQG